MRRAALAAIERKLFIHDPNRQRLCDRKLMGTTNRLPEYPQVTPGQSSRSGVNEFVKIHRLRHNSYPDRDCPAKEPQSQGPRKRFVFEPQFWIIRFFAWPINLMNNQYKRIVADQIPRITGKLSPDVLNEPVWPEEAQVLFSMEGGTQ